MPDPGLDSPRRAGGTIIPARAWGAMAQVIQDTAWDGDLTGLILSLAKSYLTQDVLSARDQETIGNFKAWSRNYEQVNNPDVYLSPAIVVDLVRRFLAPGSGPILDLACGTGLIGMGLHAAGFQDLCGLDLSDAMMAQAAAKGIYRSLIPANLHQPLPLPPASFAALICCGAFYDESIEVRALAYALPLLRRGGLFLCDIEFGAWKEGGFGHVLSQLEKAGRLSFLHLAPIRMFSPGNFGPEDDPEQPQGLALVARLM